MNFFKFLKRKEMKREIDLTIRRVTYSEPTDYNKTGYTDIETNPFLIDREEIRVSWRLSGKRDDIRIGANLHCVLSLSTYGQEE